MDRYAIVAFTGTNLFQKYVRLILYLLKIFGLDTLSMSFAEMFGIEETGL